MKSKIVYPLLIMAIVTMTTVGCGVPKSEHEKIVHELEKATQDKTTLSDQVNTLKSENENLTVKVSEMGNQINALKQENQDLLAKAAKKPAASTRKK